MLVRDFFKGKCIFITGGSGFIGKVLIEKLLRSCDGIEKIYLLLRRKKDKSPEERLEEIVNSHLFDTLRRINQKAFSKLTIICGDVKEPGLGLTEEDIHTLTENVDIIYHAAASVRFDDSLKDSILLNTRGTNEVINIALQAKKTITFIHISTSYCHSDKIEIEEKLYPPHVDWRNMVTLAEQVDQHTLNILSPQYIYPLPNTYTFAKSLSEHVVNDLCKGKLHAAIVRPSIVIPSLDDPIPGWVDNFNGPLGLVCAVGKGILKISYGEKETVLDCVPVDVFVKILILTTYEKTLSNDLNEVPVYNATAGKDWSIKNKELIAMGSRLLWDAPYTKIFSFPSLSITNNWYIFYINFLLYHMIPALVFDGILKLAGMKPMIIKIQRKVYIANMALIYFMQNTWTFKNAKTVGLHKHLEECERLTFSFVHCLGFTKEDKYTFCLKAKIGTSALFAEKFDRKKGFRNTMILWVLKILLQIAVFSLLCWYLVIRLEIFNIFNNMINSYVIYLNQL